MEDEGGCEDLWICSQLIWRVGDLGTPWLVAGTWSESSLMETGPSDCAIRLNSLVPSLTATILQPDLTHWLGLEVDLHAHAKICSGAPPAGEQTHLLFYCHPTVRGQAPVESPQFYKWTKGRRDLAKVMQKVGEDQSFDLGVPEPFCTWRKPAVLAESIPPEMLAIDVFSFTYWIQELFLSLTVEVCCIFTMGETTRQPSLWRNNNTLSWLAAAVPGRLCNNFHCLHLSKNENILFWK